MQVHNNIIPVDNLVQYGDEVSYSLKNKTVGKSKTHNLEHMWQSQKSRYESLWSGLGLGLSKLVWRYCLPPPPLSSVHNTDKHTNFAFIIQHEHSSMTSSSPIDVYEKKLKIAIHAQLIKNTSRVDHQKQLLV